MLAAKRSLVGIASGLTDGRGAVAVGRLGVWHESPGGVSGYVEVMAPIQLGDELRAALVSRQGAGVCCACIAPTRRAGSPATRSHW